jgi:hypothetical protein
MKQNDALKQPFFAKLLESQESTPSPDNTQAFFPFPPITGKLPDDGYQTMKYPSDGDDDYPKI